MQRICATVMALALLSAPVFAQTRAGDQLTVLPQAQLDVVKVMLQQERTWNSGDLDGFLKTYKDSPDLLILSGGIARGYADLVAGYKRTYPDKASMGKLTFSDLEPHMLDDRFAAVTGRYQLERPKNKGGNASGVFSIVMEKTADGWRVVLDHTT